MAATSWKRNKAMTEEANHYEAADGVEIGKAQEAILGEKPRLPPDSIVGDPDMWHSPMNFAEYEN
jgi:hypothetical protein